MIRNNVEAARKAAEITQRLENGEIDKETAKVLLKGVETYQKACMIDLMKYKSGIEQLPSEDSLIEGKMFKKLVN